MIERRRHKRILTLRNFRWALLILAGVFVGLSIDFAARRSSGDFGALYGKRMASNDDIKPRPVVVTEAPVTDQTSADPMLVAPAAREQEFLSTTEQRPTPIGAPVATTVSGSGSGVNIVGDAGGVVIVRGGEAAKRPVLAGGIFKQP